MLKRVAALAVVALFAVVAGADDDKVKPQDFCFALLGFEGDGGPVFVIADEKIYKETGELVGPPSSIVPAGFIRHPESDETFEYRGTIAAGRAALEEAGFKECPEII